MLNFCCPSNTGSTISGSKQPPRGWRTMTTTTTDIIETKIAVTTTTRMSLVVPEALARRRTKRRNNTIILKVFALLLFIVSRNDIICQTNSFQINSLSRRNCRKTSFPSSERQKSTGSITMSRQLLLWMYRETNDINNDDIRDSSSSSSSILLSGTTTTSSSVLVPKSNTTTKVRSESKDNKEEKPPVVRRQSSNYNNKYLRTIIRKHPLTGEETHVLLQTRVQRFQKVVGDTIIVIDLHAQVHFADKTYFQYYNHLNDEYDKILYELIVSDDFLYESSPDIRHLTLEASELLGSSVEAQQTAQMYGLCSQVDEMNYGSSSSSKKWICADYTREELNNLRQETQQQRRSSSSSRSTVVSTSTPLQEVVQAFWQPTTPSSVGDSSLSNKEIQLFSNLFLKGKSITSVIRIMLWFLIPVPELSILILDWSSLNKPKPGGLSPLAIQTLSSLLLYGNIPIARKLVFAQIIVSGQSSSSSSSGSVEADPNMVIKRNERALKVLKQVIQNDTARNESTTKKYALLYGALHCNDLQRRLLDDEGFQLVDRSTSSSDDYNDSEWRTAWKIPLPQSQSQSQFVVEQQPSTSTDGTKRIDNTTITTASTNNNNIPFFILWIALYLGISGVDWLAVWKDVGTSVEHQEWFEGFAIALFYLGRHAAMYFGLSKFLIEWDPNNSSSTSNQ